MIGTRLRYFYFSNTEMSIPSRSYRGQSNSAYLEVNNADEGVGVNRKTGPFELPKPDKTGAHAISTWNALQSKSMGESIYSENIKRAVNGSTSTNPNIIKSDIINEPKAERCACDTRLAGPETFCGCGDLFVKNTDRLLKIGPVVIGILVFIALCILLWIVIKRCAPKRNSGFSSAPVSQSMQGGFVDEESVDII